MPVVERVRRGPRCESGFTLAEVLVVLAIVGVLAAIAIALLVNQSEKAKDAAAKTQARTAQTAAEAYATDHNGDYKGLEVSALQALQPTLSDQSAARLIKAEARGAGFMVESESVGTRSKYTIERVEGGEVRRSCEREKAGGCPAGGSW